MQSNVACFFWVEEKARIIIIGITDDNSENYSTNDESNHCSPADNPRKNALLSKRLPQLRDKLSLAPSIQVLMVEIADSIRLVRALCASDAQRSDA